MVNARRRMLAAQPHPVTASGAWVNFSTDVSGLMQVSGDGNITSCGKNVFDEVYPGITTNPDTVQYRAVYVGANTVTVSSTIGWSSYNARNLFALPGNVSTGASTSGNGISIEQPRTVTAVNGYITIGYRKRGGANPAEAQTMIEIGSTATAYEPFSGTTATAGSREQKNGINNVWSASGSVNVTYWTH